MNKYAEATGMNKLLISAACSLWLVGLSAQKNVQATDHVTIDGKIKSSITYSLSDLAALPSVEISDAVLYNHKGEIKDTLRNMRGIPLKSLMNPVVFDYEQPRELNEFYFLFTASDGYKVVFRGMKSIIQLWEINCT